MHDVEVLHYHERVSADALGHVHGNHAVGQITFVLVRHKIAPSKRFADALNQLERVEAEEPGLNGWCAGLGGSYFVAHIVLSVVKKFVLCQRARRG